MGRKSFGRQIQWPALLLVIAMILGACTGTETGETTGEGDTGTTEEGAPDTTEEGDTGTTAGPATEDVPNPGVMVVTTDDEPATLDPAQVSPTDVARSNIFQVYERLLEVPADGTELVPGLATEVPTLDNGGISEDGLTYTFNIREGVLFHDGTDLTAEDVKYSWDRVVEMALPEGQAETFSNVASTTAVDDFTFQVTLNSVDSGFLYGVAASMAASVVSPDAVEANGGIVAGQPNEFMAQNMVGTGAYQFTEWAHGEFLDFAIFEDYWGEPAHLPVHQLVLIKEAAPGMAAGEYDVINMVPTDVPKLEGVENAVVETDLLGLQLLEIGFNMNIDTSIQPDGDTVPADFFQDVRVRQAFNYAFDYQGYIDGVLAGIGERGSFVLPKGILGYDPEAPVYPTDPAQAEALFTEAGWWDEGFTVSILTDQTHDGFTGAALAMKDGIEALNPNFHVNVLGVPEARFDEIIATQPLAVPMWSYTSPELRGPNEYFMNAAHPDGPWGTLGSFGDGYTDTARVVDLIESARTELDLDTRLGIYTELQNVLYEEAPWVMPAQEGAPIGYGEWMKGVVINPMWPRPTTKWSLYDK
ncbi:MAG: ABC transporter substrate-binding protein [Acidimicrobiia bacterium]